MGKEKMNIRKRVKETLALALSLLMVLGVICVPIHLDAAPSIPTGQYFFEGDEVSFTDEDYYIFAYTPAAKSTGGGIYIINPSEAAVTISGGGQWYAQGAKIEFPHYDDADLPNHGSLKSIYTYSGCDWTATVDGKECYMVNFLEYSGIKVLLLDSAGTLQATQYGYYIYAENNPENGTADTPVWEDAYPISIEDDPTYGDNIGWSTNRAYVDKTSAGYFTGVENGISIDDVLSYLSSGTLTLYPVYDYADPATPLSVSLEREYVLEDVDSISPTITGTRAEDDNLTIEFYKDGEDAPLADNKITEAGQYEVRVSVPAVLSEINADGELVSRGLVAEEATASFKVVESAKVTTEPKANTLSYTGEEQELLTAGDSDQGVLYYWIDGPDSLPSTNVPKATAVGTYSVKYYVMGVDGYGNSPTYTIEASIGPKTIGLNWSDTEFVYDGEDHLPSVTATGVVDGETCDVTVTGAARTVGTHTATATEVSNDNYKLPTANSTSFTISSADPTYVLPDANDLTYDGTAQELVSGGEVEGGHFEYSTSQTGTYSETVPSATNAGTYSVWVKVVGDANHNDTDPVEIEASIAKKTIGLRWSDTTFEYDGEEHVPTATATGVASGDTVNVTVTGAQTDAGNYTATATAISGTGSANYELPATVTAEFEITRADALWTVEPAAKTGLKYAKEYLELVTAGTTEDGTVQYALQGTTGDANWGSDIPTRAYAGTYTVLYRIVGDDNHNDSDTGSVEVIIAKGDGDLDGIEPADDLVYDGTEQTLFLAYSAPGEFAPSPYNIVYSTDGGTTFTDTMPKRTEADTYSVVAKRLETADTLESDPVTFEITIEPAEAGVFWDETTLNFTYDGLMHKPTAAATGLLDGDTATITVTGEKADAGTYTATASEISNTNYKLSGTTTISFTIGKIPATITTAPVAKKLTENGSEQALVEAGAVNGGSMYYALSETGTYSTAVPKAKNAGTYTVWYKAVGDGNHTDSEGAYVTVTVKSGPKQPVKEKANGSISISMGSFIFGGAATSPMVTSSTHDASKATISYKPAGAPDSAYTANKPTLVGDYTVRASVSENDNYKGCSNTANFSISYLPVPDGSYEITGEEGNGGWYVSEVKLTPAAGYEISVGNRSAFTTNAVVLSEEMAGTPFYIRKTQTGEQTAGITLASMRIDAEKPQLEMEENQIYYSDEEGLLIAMAKDKNFNKVYIDGREVDVRDDGNGYKIFDLPVGKKKIPVRIKVVDLAGNEIDMSVVTAPEWLKTGVIREGDLYLETATAYKTPEGKAVWMNNYESTKYMGGITFYAKEEKDYTFHKE